MFPSSAALTSRGKLLTEIAKAKSSKCSFTLVESSSNMTCQTSELPLLPTNTSPNVTEHQCCPTLNTQALNVFPEPEIPVQMISLPVVTETCSAFSVLSREQIQQFFNDIPPSHSSNNDQELPPPNSQLPIHPCVERNFQFIENALFHLLNLTTDGKSILNFYKREQKLDNKKRRLLADLIIRTELSADADKQLQTQDFINMSQSICELFPAEKMNTYYIPFKINGMKKINAKGKLFDKYHNLRRKYLADGLIERRHKKKSNESSITFQADSESEDDGVSEAIEWLTFSASPWHLVKEKWKATAKARLSFFYAGDHTITDYVNNFPALKSSEAAELIDIDFKVQYGAAVNNLFELWPKLQTVLLLSAQKKVKEDKNFRAVLEEYSLNINSLDDDLKPLVALLMLSFLVPLNNVTRKRKHSNEEHPKIWRPSRVEAKDGFLFFIKSASNLKTDVDERIKKLSLLGHRCQAFIIALKCDQSFQFYTYFNGHYYKVQSVLMAIDLCFKLFMVFNAEYPVESYLIWTFIEQYIYKIVSSNNVSYSCLSSLATDLGL